tara:strand:- start:252 stop:377 length:126 start_codon:yes stop_codon:yes gene_type:complete
MGLSGYEMQREDVLGDIMTEFYRELKMILDESLLNKKLGWL